MGCQTAQYVGMAETSCFLLYFFGCVCYFVRRFGFALRLYYTFSLAITIILMLACHGVRTVISFHSKKQIAVTDAVEIVK